MRRAAIALIGVVLFTLAGASPASAASANQRFVITDTSSASTFTAIGPISGSGRDVTLTSTDDDDGSFHETTRTDFANGSIFITVDGEETGFSYNEDTCVGRFKGKGTFEITGGTKAYAGATGSGTFTFRGSFAGCDEETGNYSSIVRARGNVTLD